MKRMNTDKDLITRIREGLGLGLDTIRTPFERVSKHSRGRRFRATKAYADDRQRAKRNRRKNGLRRRRN
jgi:hypothetical protein